LPVVDQKVAMVNLDSFSVGQVVSVDEKGAHGIQMRCTVSTQEGDCGSAYVNTNGSIVGFHFKRGMKDRDNLAIPVMAELLQLQPKN
jgi:hypothetical protein